MSLSGTSKLALDGVCHTPLSGVGVLAGGVSQLFPLVTTVAALGKALAGSNVSYLLSMWPQ